MTPVYVRRCTTDRSGFRALNGRRVADVFDPHPAHHLTRDRFEVPVVHVDTLQAPDFLDFVHEILLQLLLAADIQNVVRIARPAHQRIAGRNALAFLR